MDFIEKHLGFSPDHGDGSFEAMLLMVVVTIITGIAVRFFRRQHRMAVAGKSQCLVIIESKYVSY
ncbi:MAG: hypothetical protein WBE93_18135, partial [Pseudolabrys sp.]